MLAAPGVGAEGLEQVAMKTTLMQMMRANKIEDLTRLWRSFTWLRRNSSKHNWFQHDYQFIRREAHKARLM